MDERELIRRCKRNDAEAQRELYDTYGPKLFAVCRRYLKVVEDAEDAFSEAMFKILTKIGSFKGKGSFEGWMRRIVINEALMFLRKQHNFRLSVEIDNITLSEPSKAISKLSAEEIMACILELPTGYRTVFNLYEIEGYKHREIAEILDISINTSKSQLILARKRLQEMIKKKKILIQNGGNHDFLPILA